MEETKLERALAVAAPTITLIVVALFTVSFIVSVIFGFPSSLGLPLPVRVVGGAMIVVGLSVAAWVFRYRSPADMVVSTYFTFTKLFRRAAIAEFLGRTERLVVNGPQRYVRHPLYFGIIVVVFGWALESTYTFVLIAGVAVLLWFWLVMIPFEERELRALFGEQYTKYADVVPMLVPFTKRAKR